MNIAQESAAYLPHPGSAATSSDVSGGLSTQVLARFTRLLDLCLHNPSLFMTGCRSSGSAAERPSGPPYLNLSLEWASLATSHVVLLTRQQATTIQNG